MADTKDDQRKKNIGDGINIKKQNGKPVVKKPVKIPAQKPKK